MLIEIKFQIKRKIFGVIVPHLLFGTYLHLKNHLLFILNSNLTGCLIYLATLQVTKASFQGNIEPSAY